MTIRIYCPACRTPFDVDDSLAGEKGLCPSCNTKFTIRRPEAPSTGHTHALGLSSGASMLPPEPRPCGLAVTLAMALLGAFGGALIWAFSAYPAGSMPPNYFQVMGKCHPMVLHLPIGMLLGALVLDFFGGRGRVHSGAVTWLLWLTLLLGSVTALAGYFLGLNDHKGDTITFDRHLWTGIAVPLTAGLTLITKLIHDFRPTMATGIYRVPLLATATAVVLAVHFGGKMTHGFDVTEEIKGLTLAQAAPAVPTVPAAAPNAAPAPAPAAVPAPAAAPAPAPAAVPTPAPAPAPAPSPADEKVKALEKELGISLLPIAQNDPGLTFNCVNVADKFGDAELAKFAPVADRLVELNLSRCKVTDAGMAAVAGMKGLKRLNLANTAVTDAAAGQLAGLTTLEYLNLVGTKVTDAAMPGLEKNTALKKLYVWQTGVTKPAAESLHAKLPSITINLGWDSEVKTAQAAAPPPAPTPTPAPAAGPLDPEKPVYAGLIEPILASRCTGCHGEKKQKGKLAMHTLELLMKGGDSGEKTVVAGKSADSLIIKRLGLPPDEDEHMPPKDKDQLTEKEIKILKWWIDSGLKNDVKIKEAGLPEDLK